MFLLNPRGRLLRIAWLQSTATVTLCALLCSCGGSDNSPTGTSSARDVGVSAKSSCERSGSTSGIEGTGLRNKLTGRITAITASGADTTVAVGSTCFAASGASVFDGGTSVSLANLQVDQLIAAEGSFGAQSGNYASSIYILQSAGSPPPQSVQELRFFDPKGPAVWGTANWGPDVMLAPSATVLIDGVQVPAAGLTVDNEEIALVTGVLTFDPPYNQLGLLTAGRIEIAHLLDGPLDSLDIVHGVATVLGVTVYLDSQTRLDPSTLQASMRVRVSGHPTASGGADATLIAQSAASGDYLVTNFISSIEPGSKQLKIGGLSVDYAAAMLQGFSADGPQAGDHVRVKGSLSGATLIAASMAYLSPQLPGSAGDLVSLQGIVTAVASPSEVRVDGYTVSVTNAAIQACGAPPQLGAGAALDGTLQASGEVSAADFCASSLAVTSYKHLVITGPVDAIDPSFGTLSILGFDVQPNGATPLPSGIKIGDIVQGYGFPGAAPGVLMSPSVEPAPGQTPYIDVYHGFVTYAANPFIYVLGRVITIPPDVTFGGFPVPMTRSAFFSGPDLNGLTEYTGADCGDAYNFDLSVDRGQDGSLTARSVGFHYTRC
jgi:hypothetical protein